MATDPGAFLAKAGRHRWALGFAVALLSTGLCMAARVALEPIYHDDLVFLLFVPALIASAAAGGLVPSLFAGVLSTIAAFGLTGFGRPDDLEPVIRAGVFMGLSVATGLVGSRMLRSAEAARGVVADLEAREAQDRKSVV